MFCPNDVVLAGCGILMNDEKSQVFYSMIHLERNPKLHQYLKS